MREIGVYEWFDLLDREPHRDQEVMRLLFKNLDGYQASQPSTEDMIQLVNLFSAIRLHQLKHSHKP